MSDRDEFGAFLVGFIVGGLTGAVVSLLFAPQSGEETRAPTDRAYKVVFMEREMTEILASQQKMLSRRSEESRSTDQEMEAQFREHLRATKYWLARQPHLSVLYVDYNKLIADPDAYCQPIADFLTIPLDVARMREVPNERLYRNRAPSP